MASAGLRRLVAYISIFLLGCTSFGWLLLMSIPYGWLKRMSLFYTFDIGLYEVKVGGGAIGHTLEFTAEAAGLPDSITNTLKSLNGMKTDIVDVAHRMCQLPNIGADFCGLWSRLRMSSIACMVLGVTGALMQILAASFMYVYWNRLARAKTRQWYQFFLLICPVIYLVNLIQYVAFTWELPQFPPKTQGSCWGANLMFAIMLTIFSFVPLFLTSTIATKSMDEGLVEARRNLREAEADAAVEMRCRNADVDGLAAALPNYAVSTQAPWSDYSQPSTAAGYPGAPGYQQSPDYSQHAPGYPGSDYSQQSPGYPGSGYSQQSPSSQNFQPYNYGQEQQAPPSWGSVPTGIVLQPGPPAGYGSSSPFQSNGGMPSYDHQQPYGQQQQYPGPPPYPSQPGAWG